MGWGIRGGPINHILGEEELEIPLEHKVISLSVIIVMISITMADFQIFSNFYSHFFCFLFETH